MCITIYVCVCVIYVVVCWRWWEQQKGGKWTNVRGGYRRDKTPVTAFKAVVDTTTPYMQHLILWNFNLNF